MPDSRNSMLKDTVRAVEKLERRYQNEDIFKIPTTISGFAKLLGDPRCKDLAPFQLDFTSWFEDINNLRGQIKSARGTGKSVIAALCSLWSALALPQMYPDKFPMGYHVTVLGGCLPSGEKVLTNGKLNKIEEVNVGDKAITKTCGKIITETMNRPYNGIIYHVIPFGNPMGIKVTGNHPILVERNNEELWIPAKQLDVGDVLVYNVPNFKYLELKDIYLGEYHKYGPMSKRKPNTIKICSEFFRLAGYYIAEGASNKRNIMLSFNKGEELFVNDVVNCAKVLGFCAHVTDKINHYVITIGSGLLVKKFKELFGKNAHEKQFPEEWLGLDNKYLYEMFTAYACGDGNFEERRLGLCTVSERLASQMFLLCLKLRLIPSINYREREIKFNHYLKTHISKCYEIRVSSTFETRSRGKNIFYRDNKLYSPIRKINTEQFSGLVYNLEVEDDHFYTTPYVTLHNSYDQARNVYSFIETWCRTDLIKPYLLDEPRREYTIFKNKSWIRVLRASMTSVHGPHPELLWIDEAMDATDDIITEALPQVDSSQHGKWIMSSTPYVPFGVFIDFWNNADDYKIRTFGPWSALKAPWIKNIEIQKKSLSKNKFKISYLGIEDIGEANVFPLESIEECQNIYDHNEIEITKDDHLTFNEEESKMCGLDWGQRHPTVLTVGQEDDNEVIKVIFLKEWKKNLYTIISKEVERYYKKFYPCIINADSEAKGENERLQRERQLNLRPIKFHLPYKHEMVENTRWFLENRKVYLHPVLCKTLIRQLTGYMFDPKKEKMTYAKGNDDYVDSFMLMLWGYKRRFLFDNDSVPSVTSVDDPRVSKFSLGTADLPSSVKEILNRRMENE